TSMGASSRIAFVSSSSDIVSFTAASSMSGSTEAMPMKPTAARTRAAMAMMKEAMPGPAWGRDSLAGSCAGSLAEPFTDSIARLLSFFCFPNHSENEKHSKGETALGQKMVRGGLRAGGAGRGARRLRRACAGGRADGKRKRHVRHRHPVPHVPCTWIVHGGLGRVRGRQAALRSGGRVAVHGGDRAVFRKPLRAGTHGLQSARSRRADRRHLLCRGLGGAGAFPAE